MKSPVIAVGLKIIVSLNCLKANKAQLNTMHSKKEQLPQGRNMVYPGPIDPYFLAVILIPEPHFPQHFDP